MDSVILILQIVAPVFLVVAMGAGWIWLGQDFPVEFVTRFATKLAVPALIVVVLMQSELSSAAVTEMFFASIAGYVALLIVFAGFCVVFGLAIRTYLAPLGFGNTGNLGLPLCLFAFGETGLEFAVVVFAVTSVLSFSVGIGLVSGKWSLRRLLSEPIFLGTVIGVALLYSDIHTPDWMTRFLELVGQMAIPLVLVTLGASLARLTGQFFLKAAGLSILKIGMAVCIGWMVSRAFGLSGVAQSVLIVQLSTPVAVTSFMLAKLYGSEPDQVATLVITSTILSVLTLPFLLAFLV
ncbi:MAG: AEC family transporter [Pseudomonadota bacterium]